MRKHILVFTILTAVLISLVPLSVFADNISYIVPFATSPITYNSPDEQYNTFFWYGVGNDGAGTYAQYGVTGGSYNGDLYAFMYSTGTNSYKLVFAIDGDILSTEQIDFQYSTYYNAGAGGNIRRDSYSTYNALLNVRYKEISTTYSGVPYLNVFSSRDDGLNSLRTAIDNGTAGGSTVSAKTAIVTVQPGYVAYIAVAGGNVTMEATFPYKFMNGNVSSIKWDYASNLPSGEFQFGDSIINGNTTTVKNITWDAKPPKDVLGRSYTGIYEINDLVGPYFVIYVPIEGMRSGGNPAVTCTFDSAVSVTQYPVNNVQMGSSLVGVGNSDTFYVADNEHLISGIPDYVYSYTDTNGDTVEVPVTSIPAGGNNLMPDDSETSFNGIFENILLILKAPIEHIQNLFNAGVSFFGWIAQLWIWLPPAVSGIITSALVALIAIGVIKFLWK